MKMKTGWVDLQVGGFVGVDFSSLELTKDSFRKACREILSSGTSVFLPAIGTVSEDIYEQNLPLIAEVISDSEFSSRIPGFHLEGPFLSPMQGASGAHNPKWMKKPEIDVLRKLSMLCGEKIKLLTLAAELEGVGNLIRYASKAGISVSLGHQLADAEQIAEAAKAGAKALTHLGNGLPQMLPRHPNPIWDGIAEDSLTAMLITDGHHLPLSVIKTIIRAKGVGKCIVVSDAAPAAGLPPGRYKHLSNDIVLDRSGRLYCPSLNCLSGSSFSMSRCMNYLERLGFLSEKELLMLGYENPLKLIS